MSKAPQILTSKYKTGAVFFILLTLLTHTWMFPGAKAGL